MQYTGTVARVETRSGSSARGPWTMYTLILDTDNGEAKIGVGFDAPKVSPGQIITVEASTNSRGYLEGNPKTINVVGAAAVPTGSVQRAAPDDQRQRSIVAQSSYKTAADVLSVAISSGAIKLPAAKTAANDQLGVVLDALDEIAQHIFNRTLGGLTVEEPDASGEEGDYDPTR